MKAQQLHEKCYLMKKRTMCESFSVIVLVHHLCKGHGDDETDAPLGVAGVKIGKG